MTTYIPTKDELSDIVFQAVKELFEKELPSILRKAKRKPWINTEELMELTGWSRRTCQYMRDERRIPFSQEGRKILYPTDGIEKYLEGNKIDPYS